MTVQEREPLDPAKAMREHEGHAPGLLGPCRSRAVDAGDFEPRCEPYRLAEALVKCDAEIATLRKQKQRVEALRKRYRFLGGDWAGFAEDLDAALAGEDAADQQRDRDCPRTPHLALDCPSDEPLDARTYHLPNDGEGAADQPQGEVCGKPFTFWANCELPPHGPDVKCAGRTVFEKVRP